MSHPPNHPARLTDPTLSVRSVIERATLGDATALPDLRKILNNPRVTQYLGDLARRVRFDLICNLANTDLALREAAKRELDRMRAELAGPNPSPLERLLVERVAVGWLQVHQADWALCRSAESAYAEPLQVQSDHAQRRFLAAVRALAAVRKLALPALQVNIAEQQVNVAG